MAGQPQKIQSLLYVCIQMAIRCFNVNVLSVPLPQISACVVISLDVVNVPNKQSTVCVIPPEVLLSIKS